MAYGAKVKQALLQFHALVEEAKQRDEERLERDGVLIEKLDEWRNYDRCERGGCEGTAPATLWKATRGEREIELWELIFHYAVEDHPITARDLPARDVIQLLAVFPQP